MTCDFVVVTVHQSLHSRRTKGTEFFNSRHCLGIVFGNGFDGQALSGFFSKGDLCGNGEDKEERKQRELNSHRDLQEIWDVFERGK